MILICLTLLFGVLFSSCANHDEEIVTDSEPVYLSYGYYHGDIKYGENNEPKEVMIINSEKDFKKYRDLLSFEDPLRSETFNFKESSLLLILGIHNTSFGPLKSDIEKEGVFYHIHLTFMDPNLTLQALSPWYAAYKVPKNSKAANFIVDVSTVRNWQE